MADERSRRGRSPLDLESRFQSRIYSRSEGHTGDNQSDAETRSPSEYSEREVDPALITPEEVESVADRANKRGRAEGIIDFLKLYFPDESNRLDDLLEAALKNKDPARYIYSYIHQNQWMEGAEFPPRW